VSYFNDGIPQDREFAGRAKTLEPLKTVRHQALVAVAAHVGPARLIDNFPWRGR